MRSFLAAIPLACLVVMTVSPAQAQTALDERFPLSGWYVYRPFEKPLPRKPARTKRYHAKKVHHVKTAKVIKVSVPVPVQKPVVQDASLPGESIWIVGRVIDKVNIFTGYLASLLRPVGNCREWQTVDIRVRTVVADAAKHFGSPALLTSCYRPVAYNRRIGGARHSQHIAHKALDFKITGVSPWSLARWVRQHPIMRRIGGVGRYANNQIVHIDSGPKRNWCWGCSTTRFASRHRARA